MTTNLPTVIQRPEIHPVTNAAHAIKFMSDMHNAELLPRFADIARMKTALDGLVNQLLSEMRRAA